ncbi:MAG: hypothetical protein ACRCX2_05955 [Paraclostridium sp.]
MKVKNMNFVPALVGVMQIAFLDNTVLGVMLCFLSLFLDINDNLRELIYETRKMNKIMIDRRD